MPLDPDSLVVRPFAPGDEDGVLRLHNRLLGDATRGLAAITAEHWRWKYLANPCGPVHLMLAEHPRQGIVGTYPAVPMRISCGGQRALSLQAVDQAVAPEWLARGGPNGLFVRLGEEFLRRWLGRNAGQAEFVFGLPIVSWRSGATHLGWQIVRDFDACWREVPPGSGARATAADLEVRTVPRFDDTVDELFAPREQGPDLATVRDHTWLNWRYAATPTRSFVLFECRERRTGRLRGIAIYGRGDLVRPNTSFVLDVLHDDFDQDARTALVAALEGRTRADGTGLLVAVWNPHSPDFLAWQELGYRVRATPWFLVALSPMHDPVFLRQHWRFSLGDCDLL
jgi:hypothetical protein